MRVVQVVSEGMLQVRMRSRLQFTVEQEMPLMTREEPRLVTLEATAPARVLEITPPAEPAAPAQENVEPVAKPKNGVVIEWPSKLSSTLRKMKAAITPAANTEALSLFQPSTSPR